MGLTTRVAATPAAVPSKVTNRITHLKRTTALSARRQSSPLSYSGKPTPRNACVSAERSGAGTEASGAGKLLVVIGCARSPIARVNPGVGPPRRNSDTRVIRLMRHRPAWRCRPAMPQIRATGGEWWMQLGAPAGHRTLLRGRDTVARTLRTGQANHSRTSTNVDTRCTRQGRTRGGRRRRAESRGAAAHRTGVEGTHSRPHCRRRAHAARELRHGPPPGGLRCDGVRARPGRAGPAEAPRLRP